MLIYKGFEKIEGAKIGGKIYNFPNWFWSPFIPDFYQEKEIKMMGRMFFK